MAEPDPPADHARSLGSRLLSGVERWASRPLLALIVHTADIAWVLVNVATGFPGGGRAPFRPGTAGYWPLRGPVVFLAGPLGGGGDVRVRSSLVDYCMR